MTVTVESPRALVCSPDHLASSAGVAILRAGGTAVDAAVGASAVLAVTSPHMCGMGGDLLALVHNGRGDVHALQANGRSGSGADLDRIRADGHVTMPFRGDVRSVPVPGCVDGWLALHERYGGRPLTEILAPAIAYATEGFPVAPLLAEASQLLLDVPEAGELASAGGLRPGHMLRRPGVAAALRAIITDGRDGFYLGDFGRGLLELGSGEFTAEDLRRPNADWVAPLTTSVWGHRIDTTPPVSQGYLTLLAARVAAQQALPDDPQDERWPHLLVEASRAAGFDRPNVLHDGADGTALINDTLVTERAGLVDADRRSALPEPGGRAGTIAVTVVDSSRRGVALVQSNAAGFGSNIFEPSTGIGLHNRGIGFSLEPRHPASYGPGRRPPTTLAPILISHHDGQLRSVLATMGADSQPQILLQLLARTLLHGESPGTAVGAGRWVLGSDGGHLFETWTRSQHQVVRVEEHAPSVWRPALEQRGHRVVVAVAPKVNFGHAQLVTVEGEVLRGAVDPRSVSGAACGY